jgi:ubiquinone/menaquinone biosynthesis C-methylase UbiE
MNEGAIQSEQVESAANAFSKQSVIFDSLEKENIIIQWMRKRIHNHCATIYKTGETLLELNCGTGIDAIYFSSLGLKILATDISEEMLAQLNQKIKSQNLQEKIETMQCSFLELEKIHNKKFNHVFSNFGGLNCTDKLSSVIEQLDKLLLPGGTITFVIMPQVCLWEMLFALKGDLKTAFRRLKKNGAESNVEGISFLSYYYSASQVKKMFSPHYKKLFQMGLCSVAPPPYLDKFAIRNPKMFRLLSKADEKLSIIPPFNSWADHFLITMKKQN